MAPWKVESGGAGVSMKSRVVERKPGRNRKIKKQRSIFGKSMILSISNGFR